MSEYDVGFFVVPAGHMAEIREIEKEYEQAMAEARYDGLYLANQVFERARRVAVVAEVLHGEVHESYSALSRWLGERFLGGRLGKVFTTAAFSSMRSHLGEGTLEEVDRWARAHEWQIGAIDWARLRALCETLCKVIASAPPGPHGFVTCVFREAYRDPPPPPELMGSDPPLAPEDGARFDEILDRGHRLWLERQQPGWTERRNQGRMLLGVLPPDQGRRFRQLREVVSDIFGEERRYVAYHEAMRTLMTELELALARAGDPLITDHAGLVQALVWLYIKADCDDWKRFREVAANPEEVQALSARLDELEDKLGGEEGVVEAVWKMEEKWSRRHARTAYARLRATVARALAQGAWLVWLNDHYQ